MPRITTPFGHQSTAAEVVAGIDLSGRRAIVTGASSGIGVETARALARTGAGVTLAVRDLEAGRRVAADIAATTGAAGHLPAAGRHRRPVFRRLQRGGAGHAAHRGMSGVAPYALDAENADRLWELSLRLLEKHLRA